MGCRGIRGATSVARNEEREILDATRTLLERIVSENAISLERIVSVIFTATADLNAAYPARAARELGWRETPLLCALDMDVPGSLPRCIRVLMHVDGDEAPNVVRHVYLGAATSLRPDWAEEAGT